MEIDASQEVDLYDSSLCMENEMTKFGEEKPGLFTRCPQVFPNTNVISFTYWFFQSVTIAVIQQEYTARSVAATIPSNVQT